MKRIIVFFIIGGLLMPEFYAQNINDALRYSMDQINGTARFNAMGGAFGSLGGDLSAIAINPAGSAVFLNNSASASLNVTNADQNATYFSSTESTSFSNIDFNQAGFVFVFNNTNQESKWNKFTIGLNYVNTQNFDQDLFISGIGNSSIGNFFLEQAQGVPLDLLQLQSGETIASLYGYLGENFGTSYQNAFLGYQGYIFDPVDPNDIENTLYTSAVAPGDFNQKYIYITRGFNAQYTFNFATQYKDRFYFGINLNSHNIDYTQYNFLEENNTNAGSSIRYIGFENRLNVLGEGFSAQAGIIAKINSEIRVSASYKTPTWYTISEETIQFLETDRIDGANIITTTVDPQTLNIFADYRLQTPGKIATGFAYVFGTRGLISLDYEYTDYSSIRFKPQNDSYFSNQNMILSNNLKAVSTIRLGGEFKHERWSFRGGFRFEESPYKNGNTIGDTTVFSTGLGYDFGTITLDLSYSRLSQSRKQSLYDVGLTSAASIDANINTFVLTLGYGLW